MINSAGVRIPIYAYLEPKKLRRLRSEHGVTYRYEGTTADPVDAEIITDVVRNRG